MRRIEIQEALREVTDALKLSGLVDLVKGSVGPRQIETIAALKDFAIFESRFTPIARKLEHIFELQQLCDTDTWQHIFGQEREVFIHAFGSRINRVMDLVPKFVALLDQQSDEDYIAFRKGEATSSEYSKVTVIVIEEHAQFSRPERLVQVLSGFIQLYENCARLAHLSSNELTVLSCDSGSDKSFDFLGLAKVMEQVKEIFIGLWDRVVFYKEKRLSSQIEVIAQGLPVLARLTELEGTNHIGPEEAEIIRRGILNGCQNILSAGAIIPEIHQHSSHNPRVLMAPEKMLLMPPPAPENTPDGDPKPSAPAPASEDATAARLRELERMVSNLQAGSGPVRKPRKKPAS